MRSLPTTLALAAALLAPALLSGCDSQAIPLSWQLHNSHLPEALEDELSALISHYKETGDARHASPTHRITLLHLAALAAKPKLVRKLLSQGADPNALMRPMPGNTLHETPLSLMFNPRYSRTLRTEEMLAVVDALLAAGAEVNPTAAPCSPVLAGCCRLCLTDTQRFDGEGDELARRLLEAGARGGFQEADACIGNNWLESLALLLPTLKQDELVQLRDDLFFWGLCYEGLTPVGGPIYKKKPQGAAAAVDCAKLVLQGASIAGQPKHPAQQMFENICRWLSRERAAKLPYDRTLVADFLTTLLQHGANACSPMPQTRGHVCAADLLHGGEPTVRQLLAERGVLPARPEHHLSADLLVEQLQEIPTRAFTQEEARAAFDLLSRFITEPTAAQRTDPLEQRRACTRALALMQHGDAEHTRQWVCAQPLWREPAAWEGEALAARNLLHALQQGSSFSLPANWLLERARAMEAAGRPELARAFARLLEHDTSAEASALIEQLCAEGSPAPLRAAALTCKLHRMGLPALGEGEIREWMFTQHTNRGLDALQHVHKIAINSECSADNLPPTPEEPDLSLYNREYCYELLSTHARLMFPERLHFSGSRPNGEKTTLRALEHIGAPAAAVWYASGQGDAAAASLELEIAVALYLLKHEKAFREPGWDSFFIIFP